MTPPWLMWHDRTPLQKIYADAKAHATRNKAKVGMPQFSWSKQPVMSERERAEQHMIERLTQAVELIEFGLNELAAVPNPHTTYENRINQQMIMDVLQKLCYAVKPPIRLEYFANAMDHRHERIKMEDMPVCSQCGGPARMQWHGNAYCVDCVPNDKMARAEAREQRDAKEAAIRAMERDAEIMRKAINSLDQHLRKQEDDDGDDR